MVRSIMNRRKRKKNSQPQQHKYPQNLSKQLTSNVNNLKQILGEPHDLKIRQLKLGEGNITCAITYIDGLVDAKTVQVSILENLENAKQLPTEGKELFQHIYNKLLSVIHVEKGKTLDEITLPLLSGSTLLYIDGVETALIVDTSGGEMRSIEEPVTETLIRGPREGFIENLQTNLAIIRRHIKDPNLRFKTHQTGRRSKKNLVVAYVDGIVNPALVKEVERRLQSIDIDIVLESGYVEGWIEDSFLSPFPQIMNSERPDKVVAALMQGKVAILLEGTPFALLMPINFSNILQSAEDRYERWIIGTLLRGLRYFAAFLSIFLPALYVSLLTLQPGMLPSMLAFSIAASREGVPFPPLIEAFMMLFTMELLQEAGARLPQTIGQTIGIVGGLVIGEAAVQAGIVSPIMVIIVALTAISNFAIPAYSIAISFRIIRFGFLFASGIFGLYGIILAYIMVNIHFVNLKSFGVPYSTPFAPFFKRDFHDVIVRSPIHQIKDRPEYLQPQDTVSMDNQGEKK